MPDGADRREARRFSMSLPMRVLPREAHNKELRANTRDVSYRGLYFRSETKFEVGSQIDFEFRFGAKVQTAITDIASIGAEFLIVRFARKNAHGQAHREAPRFAA